MKPIGNLKFQSSKYPEVLSVINRLAKLEDRRPHDTAKRLILKYGKALIKEFESNSQKLEQQESTTQPAKAC